MWPQWTEELSTKRNWDILQKKPDTFQLFCVMDSLQSPVSRKTTFPSTISSARISSTEQLPPIRNRREFPLIQKQFDVIVPWGTSLWIVPAWWEGLGRFSKPQSTNSLCGWQVLCLSLMNYRRMLADCRMHCQSRSSMTIRFRNQTEYRSMLKISKTITAWGSG